LCFPGFAQAQAAHTITLIWAYTQNAQRPATSFVMQRCTQTTPPCVLADLAGATAIAVNLRTYMDTTIQANTMYCYVLMAADSAGRSALTPQVCGGAFDLTVPTQLLLTVQ
jgi:hypothetical protein